MRKGQRSFFHPNSVTALPACAISVWGGQVSAWQAVSALVSLQEECESWAKPSACRPLSQQSDPHFPHFTPFSLGASQGAAGAWGFQLQSCNLQTPGKWGRWPWPTRTVSQPSRGEENQGQRTGGGEERGTQRREEPTRREEGWQEVIGVSYPGRRLSGRFVVWRASAVWKLVLPCDLHWFYLAVLYVGKKTCPTTLNRKGKKD